jgi:hypothetical protein
VLAGARKTIVGGFKNESGMVLPGVSLAVKLTINGISSYSIENTQ